jgi:hypothetical protein
VEIQARETTQILTENFSKGRADITKLCIREVEESVVLNFRQMLEDGLQNTYADNYAVVHRESAAIARSCLPPVGCVLCDPGEPRLQNGSSSSKSLVIVSCPEGAVADPRLDHEQGHI